mmetsp:Transcript_44468/g.147412  ORF Transcript_44468/g.147412 Transcript_44468/m.147412 type:complete len:239 (+) Transcript_44468:171-887(+)
MCPHGTRTVSFDATMQIGQLCSSSSAVTRRWWMRCSTPCTSRSSWSNDSASSNSSADGSPRHRASSRSESASLCSHWCRPAAAEQQLSCHCASCCLRLSLSSRSCCLCVSRLVTDCASSSLARAHSSSDLFHRCSDASASRLIAASLSAALSAASLAAASLAAAVQEPRAVGRAKVALPVGVVPPVAAADQRLLRLGTPPHLDGARAAHAELLLLAPRARLGHLRAQLGSVQQLLIRL